MSLIVTVSTKEGVVLAGDSRTTLFKPITTKDGVIGEQSLTLSDTAYKVFRFNQSIGISTCGGAHVSGMSIAAHIENIRLQLAKDDVSVDALSDNLIAYFSSLPNCPEIAFHVAGYEIDNNSKRQRLQKVIVGGEKNLKIKVGLPELGVSWNGEISTMSRIMKAGYMVGPGNARRLREITISSNNEAGQVVRETLKDRIVIPGVAPWHPDLEVAWEFFTLQDGIDFATYAIKTTIDTMRFQSVPKTVGGPIDILVVKPDEGTKWIARKELHP